MTRQVREELRRRLGGAFTIDELVELYDDGTGWVSRPRRRGRARRAVAWDVRIVGDAAFARYLRERRDYAGGRRPADAARGENAVDDPRRARKPEPRVEVLRGAVRRR